ncbi:helix-turn-helix domain-containing protein [Moritella dasanensis]|uniref:helix-turn-helix domain-containing protein n=1 Tax=Moritella dasanensis TaxID=428031 RepID=UPI0002D8647C|nr:helix-turn-helix domain-containing protein [Moritella dasanensis]
MKITSAKQLANTLQDTRKTKSLSQTDVAKQVGIRQDTVSKFELNPDSTKLDTLFKMLAALNLELHVAPRGENLPFATENLKSNATWKEEW